MSGRKWTSDEVVKLYRYAETVSQHEAGELLGRSWHSIAHKARSIGIRWRQGIWSYRRIALEMGCSANTVRRLVHILFHSGDKVQSYGAKSGHRVLLTEEDARRVMRVLAGTLERRSDKVRAGKARHGLSVDV